MKINRSKFLLPLGACFALSMFGAASFGDIIVNDSFADGSPLNSGAALESQWFTTSSSSALDDSAMGDTPGTLEFASGSSGRAIHTVFANQNLGSIGDMLFTSVAFTTPATVGSDENNGLRVGIFNQANGSLATDISSSSSSPNPLLGDVGFAGDPDADPAVPAGTTPGLDGFSADYDVNDLSVGEPADEVQLRQSNPGSGSGRLLTTTSGFSGIGTQDAPEDSNGFVGNEDYQVSIKITRTSDTDVQVDTELTDGEGIILNSVSSTVAATSFDFSFLGLSTSSDAFGSSSSLNDADNGLRLNNVFVEFTPAAVPEPSSAMLLGLLGCVGMIRRRR